MIAFSAHLLYFDLMSLDFSRTICLNRILFIDIVDFKLLKLLSKILNLNIVHVHYTIIIITLCLICGFLCLVLSLQVNQCPLLETIYLF